MQENSPMLVFFPIFKTISFLFSFLLNVLNMLFENKITFQDFDIKTFANRDYKSDLPLWEIQFKIFKSNLINKFQNSFISFLKSKS